MGATAVADSTGTGIWLEAATARCSRCSRACVRLSSRTIALAPAASSVCTSTLQRVTTPPTEADSWAALCTKWVPANVGAPSSVPPSE